MQMHVWGHGARVLHTVDLHAAGEPARVVVGGMPHVPGKTMYEKRAYIMENLDGIRKLLLLEPRGCANSQEVLQLNGATSLSCFSCEQAITHLSFRHFYF
jgi:proline racemase